MKEVGAKHFFLVNIIVLVDRKGSTVCEPFKYWFLKMEYKQDIHYLVLLFKYCVDYLMVSALIHHPKAASQEL